VLAGDILTNFGQMIKDVYIPGLAESTHASRVENETDKGVVDTMKIEFRGNIQKFSSQIQHAIQQVKGDVHLTIPNIKIVSLEAATEDFEIMNQLELALEDWSKSVANVVESEARKVPQQKGPLAEIEFWRQRNGILSTIYEQINMPDVQQMLSILESVEAGMYPTFRFHYLELTKLYVEAKDNVKFLTTLERHFKNITNGSFTSIMDTLPSMMNAIRMVWIISRHYNTDERMVPLMERIAGEIADKVVKEIEIKTILRKPPELALTTIKEAGDVLESWHDTYMKVRRKIEESGTDHRWEFDRRRLFEQTNYMAKICENLAEVATVLDQFHKFFGPELKAVTGDSAGIDEVMARVEGLPGPLETLPFNIFDKRYKTSWDAVIVQFRDRVTEIESRTKLFIDTSFQNLMTAEGAFDLLQNFQTIQSRESINRQMMEKYQDILQAYTLELEHLKLTFDNEHHNPPIFKNYTPVAGAICWAKALYLRAKKPILKFRSMNELLKGEQGELVREKYLEFARQVDVYIKAHYNGWKDDASEAVADLRQPILKAVNAVSSVVQADSEAKFEMPPPPYAANFSEGLKMLIRESKYLDRMGFEIPESALNVTLQENKYHGFVQDLNSMLHHYYTLLEDLTPVEKDVLKMQLKELEETLKLGFTPLNWNSQRIPTFIEKCYQKLNDFGNKVTQMHKSSMMIEEVIKGIENMDLVRISDFVLGSPFDVGEFYEKLESNRLARLESLVRKYESIGNLVIKVEEIVAETGTGNSESLSSYYLFWEKQIYNALVKMIISAMSVFQIMLNMTDKSSTVSLPPLCKITAALNSSSPSIVVTPALPDIYKFLSKSVKNLVESSKLFYRWNHGSCHLSRPIKVSDDEEPIVFSYYSDISQNPYVIKMMLSLNQSIHKVFQTINKYLDSWRYYDKKYELWNDKRKKQIEKLAERELPCVWFDGRLAAYARLADTVRNQPYTKDIDFIRIDCEAVAVNIARQAENWQQEFGAILRTNASTELHHLEEKMAKWESDLEMPTKNLEDLKYLLNVVAEIGSDGMNMELSYLDVIERYRTLEIYNIPVEDESEKTMAKSIDSRWAQLVIDSKTKDLRLVRTKDKFRGVTKDQAIEFTAECKVHLKKYYQAGPGSPGLDLDVGIELVAEYYKELGELTKKKQELVNAENLFNLPITVYPELAEEQASLDKLNKVYHLYTELKDFMGTMSSMLWAELDISQLSKGVEELEKKFKRFPKELKEIPTYTAVSQRLAAFKESIPLILNLKNEAMRPRHWEELMKETGVKFTIDPKTFTLSSLFAMELHRFTEGIDEIVNKGMQEQKIENEIKNVVEVWTSTSFELIKHKKPNGEEKGYLLRAADDIKLQLEDHMLNLQTMAGSRFVTLFVDEVKGWERKLNTVSEALEVWYLVQRKWMYLESIFVAEDIRMQLPEEAKKFDAIDKAWKAIMAVTTSDPNVINATHAENRVAVLNNLSERLDKCQKSLSDYLDTKRNAFPRFFFISDDELLSVLGSSDPSSIQVHMLKLFDNVKQVKFMRNNKFCGGQISSEKEGYDFVQLTPIDGAVEVWMTAIEDEMHHSLNVITKEGVFAYAHANSRQDWLKDVLGMVSLVGSQIWWTWEVEDVFRRVRTGGNKYAMKELENKLTGQLNDLVAEVRNTGLEKLQRKKVNTMLIIDVHARDIVSEFVRDSVLDAKEFAWESQLRFYWDKGVDDCVIDQCTGRFRYGYEFMGCNGRLVITPLTDRCYMTLSQALTFKLGGSPAGPAGTGKTETVKDLAKSLALPCFVINCGDGLDYKAMGSIFSGLVQVGAWGCFDEFNRINIEVLSVVSAQIRGIQNALNYDRPTVDMGLGGEPVVIKRVAGFATCGIFITMNPGYAGRTELPDNLKALFRPVTMIKPDLLQICQIMLFSEGFEGAPQLAKKMTVLYSLSQQVLSKQHHYDFGLRALKSVLVMAGALKRESADLSEDLVLMRALRDSNMPKFIFEDVPLFKGLINDLFPGLDCPRVGYADLNSAIQEYLDKGDYHPSDEKVYNEQIDKIIQMYETMVVRHTTMIVGPTGGGKSVVLDTLQYAMLPAFNKKITTNYLNPKAQKTSELYGLMNAETRDWTDGILSKMFRELNLPLPAGKENEHRWIVFDGDVDAVWVEDMNSVMDDNRLLTLPNGERIRLQPHCSMIVETFDLQFASPATISRCGMVWVDPKNLGYKPYYERWVRLRCPNPNQEREAELLLEFYEKYMKKCIEYVLDGMVDGEITEKLQQVVPVSNLAMVQQVCSSLDAFITPAAATAADANDIEGIFIFSVIWGIGASLVGNSRIKFDAYLRKIADSPLPNTGLLYDYYFDLDMHKWEKWQTHVPAYEEPVPFAYYNIMVPTSDSVLYTYILDHIAAVQKPILFVGDSGTAKTVTIQNWLKKLDTDKFNQLNINMSSRTSSMDVQVNIESSVDKRTGKIYGPPGGKQLMVFVDDLNMPKVDLYGTQQPITLLLFLISRGNMYDRGKDLDLRIYKDMNYIGAMGPPGGGRNNVDPRFVRLFNVYNLNPPTEEVQHKIFNSILSENYKEFGPAILDVCPKITDMTLKLFNICLEKLPPTPSKFHYIFNLRDLGRVYEGMCLATPDHFQTIGGVVRLWHNECSRIFCDRLIAEEDRDLLKAEIKEIIKDGFGDAILETACAEPIVFGDFEHCVKRITEGGEDPRLYNDMKHYGAVKDIFENVLESYNIEFKPMTLVLFEMALEHTTRIHRIIRMPRGNALLVGVGGSGKQSLTRLSAYTAGFDVFEITLCRGYGETEFREELKELYRTLGSKEVVFLFTDAHVVEEGFLEFLNNMLTTGMVPALYETDERDGIINANRADCKKAGIPETSENVWNFFISKCRNNLHIVLAMSPSGDTLRVRCRNFPGLVSSSVIDWFFPWPEDALQKVATHFLAEEPLPQEFRTQIIDHIVMVHLHVVKKAKQFEEELRRYYSVTPKNYLDFIGNYAVQLKENNKKVVSSVERLAGGVAKIKEAATAVDRMQIELQEKKVVVDAKTIDCEAMIKVIKEKSEAAGISQEKAVVAQEAASKQAAIITEEKEKADVALNEALPAVEAAAAALDNLKKEDLQELKVFATPPILVKAVCLCCVYLQPTGSKLDEDWKGCKAMLGTNNLLGKLKEYNKDKIGSRMISKVKHEMKTPGMNIERMNEVSQAGAGLFVWVDAIVKYYDVAKNVAPLREKVKQMEKEQAATEKQLAELQELLAKLQKEIDELSANFEKSNGELTSLTTEATRMERQLTAANKLLTGLSSEQIRWSKDIENLNEQETRLAGDCLIASSFLSYAGAFTFDYRSDMFYGTFKEDIVNHKIPVTEAFALQNMLASDAIVQQWAGQGLPSDEHSVQNGILTTKSSRFPLCIDPQEQAVNWIKRKEADHKLTIKTLNESDFMKHLELAIQFGNPFLFENVDEDIDPMLDPVLEKNTFRTGAQKMIKLGDKTVEWDDNFRLYFTTKLANPKYSPEVMGKTMLVNYSVTMDGLANQLLNVVVGNERPDLEEQYANLVDEMSANAQVIVELEDKLLHDLAHSEGNILDNEELIATLAETKAKSTEINIKLEQAQFTKTEISKTRSGYTSVAKRGSILYFAVAGLSTIMSIYETSLNSFLSVFKGSLTRAKKDVVLENRLRNLAQRITEDMYDYACTGIFEKHKLMFSFQMTCMIMDGKGTLVRQELDFFLKGDTSLEAAAQKNPYSWLSKNNWKDLLALGQMSENFSTLVDDVTKNTAVWKAWYDLENPEMEEMPMEYTSKLTEFQRLLLFRCFRPDRVYNGVKLFVMSEMGGKYVQPPVLDYARIYQQSNNTTPLVFVLSPGADPQSDIQALGDELGFSHPKFKFLALGQGQGGLAEQLMEQGAQRGHWVLLQNCHLLLSWLKRLETFLEVISSGTTPPHEDFRLWLTTDPTDKFPLGILQRSLKVVTEPPDGLKLNMRSSYSKISDEMLEECPHESFRPVLYTLVFLHAVVLERRKYGKIGWNVPYDFNESDFNISRRLLALYLEKAHEDGDENIPWGSLKYLIGDAMYGGRVSDNFDRRVLSTYLAEYMGDFLFDDCQKYYLSQSGFDYEIPEFGPLKNYTGMVEGLPLVNSPAVFGLHPNAEIGYFTIAAKTMWTDLIALQPRTTDLGGGMSREQYIEKVANDVLVKVPEETDLMIVRKQLGGVPTPTQVVLLQELERWNILVGRMMSSLKDLKKALTGEIGMSDALDALGDSLFNGFLPGMWRKLTPNTEKPLGAWMDHFQRRYKQYMDWVEHDDPKVMWVSGLHIPESFMSALVQTTCRKKNWPLDKSTLYTKVTKIVEAKEVTEKLESGTYVEGLYLEGATWDVTEGILKRQEPKVLICNLPLLQVIPVEAAKLKLHNTFRTPVYVTQGRRNAMGVGLVFEADLTTYEHPSHWVLQGVALVLNVDF
jgi:dynein heavy chain